MNQIMFNGEYLKLIKELTSIQPSIIFEKCDNKIIVKRANDSKSMGFQVTAPSEYFTFDANKLAIKDFNGFYQAMGAFGAPSIFSEDNKIIIKSKSTKINYVLNSPESLAKSPVTIGIGDIDISFNLSQSDMAEISKANSLIKARYAGIMFDGKEIIIRLFNSSHQNSFDKTFTPVSISEGLQNFDFNIYSSIFSKIPADNDYLFSIKKTGSVGLTFNKNNIDLIIVTGRVKDLNDDNKGE
jgi:hypothetical protein